MAELGRPASAMTRRAALRSLGLLGAVAALPPLMSACDNDTVGTGPPRSPEAIGPNRSPAATGSIALADVPRSLGGAEARPEAIVAVQAFTADLYRKLAAQPGNVVCSPYSVAIALAMTRTGARGGTATEMGAVLHAPDAGRMNEGLNSLSQLVESRAGTVTGFDRTQATISLDVANSLWGQADTSWERAFLQDLAQYYGAGMRLVDYRAHAHAARTQINQWTSDQTHGRIPQIIPPDVLDDMTRLVLVNAIYFKAPWAETFPKSQTKQSPFTRAVGSRVDVTMMSGVNSLAGYGAGPGWQAVHLPYFGEKVAMTVVLPDASLTDFEAGLDGATLATVLRASTDVEYVTLHLPRWRFRLAATLNDALAALGMPTAFTPRADFSGMTKAESLLLSSVAHQAFISVDEHGTEAAAASAVIGIAQSGGGPPPVEVTVDRPFLFVIHDVETATPLFIGRVSNPRETS